jgi:hypothetical protein
MSRVNNGARLEDKQRIVLQVKIAEFLARDPSLRFPTAMALEGHLEDFYRFLNKDNPMFGYSPLRNDGKVASTKHTQSLAKPTRRRPLR